MQILEDKQFEIDAIVQLITLINPRASYANKQIAAFKRKLKNAEYDDYLFDLMREATDWKSSFFVDWKDKESFIAIIGQLAHQYNVTIDWQGYNPSKPIFDNQEKPAQSDFEYLLDLAENQLNQHQLTLWQYDTSGDAYAGWIAPTKYDDEITALGKNLTVSIAKPGENFDYIDGYSNDQISSSEDLGPKTQIFIKFMTGVVVILCLPFLAIYEILKYLVNKIFPK